MNKNVLRRYYKEVLVESPKKPGFNKQPHKKGIAEIKPIMDGKKGRIKIITDEIEGLIQVLKGDSTAKAELVILLSKISVITSEITLDELEAKLLAIKIKYSLLGTVNLNEEGPLKLGELTLEVLESFDNIPRIISINGGKDFISVIKTAQNENGQKTFTVRFGIELSNKPYPPFKGVSIFIVDENKIYVMNINTEYSDTVYSQVYEELIDKVGKGKEKVYDTIPIKQLKAGRVFKIFRVFKKSLNNCEIYDVGINSKGHRVLIIKIKDDNQKDIGEFEVNLYEENGKNVIYIGSMAKNETNRNGIIKGLELLMPRLGDIIKLFNK
ncbi:MAG: hypothetical protein PHE25_04820, partial [Candidatus Gracilibacteria bacterium]|nr:hypothetical protein [Candidatus Gracilibacteria bacterium]